MVPFAGPAEVKGRYQHIRNRLQAVLMIIFFILPWVKINDQPIILIDFLHRHFVFFGVAFFSHDTPLLFFLVILVVLSIFLVTALFGRLWCGWTCPQTVFIHALFNQIEKIIMGPFSKRSVFYKSNPSWQKNARLSFLYAVYLFFSWLLAHSFVAYFLGANLVTKSIYEGPFQHQQAFLILMTITAILFFNFTFFREKFCFYICPYGRFQNALIDRNTLTVFYDTLRGEPRGKLSPAENEKGDCVDCHRCVNVCPTKIDIRNGFQLECIACGKCIDACNDVMQKIKRPPHLIRYETGNNKPITIKRFRLALYAVLISVFLSGLIWSLNHRAPVDFNIARSHENPFSLRYKGNQKVFQNQIQIHLKNQTNRLLNIQVKLSDHNIKEGFELMSAVNKIEISPEQDLKTTAFIEILESDFYQDRNQIRLEWIVDGKTYTSMVNFIGVQ